MYQTIFKITRDELILDTVDFENRLQVVTWVSIVQVYGKIVVIAAIFNLLSAMDQWYQLTNNLVWAL